MSFYVTTVKNNEGVTIHYLTPPDKRYFFYFHLSSDECLDKGNLSFQIGQGKICKIPIINKGIVKQDSGEEFDSFISATGSHYVSLFTQPTYIR
jgi:hypothetical protein